MALPILYLTLQYYLNSSSLTKYGLQLLGSPLSYQLPPIDRNFSILSNLEKEQVSVVNELIMILSNFENIHNHNVIFASDFNIFFDASLDAKGGTSTLKSK